MLSSKKHSLDITSASLAVYLIMDNSHSEWDHNIIFVEIILSLQLSSFHRIPFPSIEHLHTYLGQILANSVVSNGQELYTVRIGCTGGFIAGRQILSAGTILARDYSQVVPPFFNWNAFKYLCKPYPALNCELWWTMNVMSLLIDGFLYQIPVNHVRQHTGETPFKCTYCEKMFTRKDHLGEFLRNI